MKVIAINNNKGGSLKTTVATNLAGTMAMKGYKVLIIDLDVQSNTPLTFGINPDELECGVYDVMVEGTPWEECVVRVHENIHILPSTDDVVDFAVLNNTKEYPKPFELLKDNLQGLEEYYDYVLLDTPPSLSLMMGNALMLSDYVLIPYVPEKYSMRSLIKVIENVQAFKQYNEKLEVLGVLPTLVKSNTRLHKAVLAETEAFLNEKEIKLFESVLPSTIFFADTVAFEETTVTLLEKKNKYAEIFDNLWKEMGLNG